MAWREAAFRPCCGGQGEQAGRPDFQSSKKNPNGKPAYGSWKCYACRQKFTVRKGAIFEERRLEFHLWFQPPAARKRNRERKKIAKTSSSALKK
jgi:hypothetical protein